jgi:hypothetical protein
MKRTHCVSVERAEANYKSTLLGIARAVSLGKALLLARGLGCMAGKFRLVHVGGPGTAPTVDLPEGAG